MLKAGFISLGCSKNLVDTEVMLGILAKNNIELTAEPAKADILIVNTCTFIQSAKEESITTILNMAEYKQPESQWKAFGTRRQGKPYSIHCLSRRSL